MNEEKIKTIIRNDSRFSLIGVIIDGITSDNDGHPTIIIEEHLDDLGRVILNGLSDCSRFEQYDEIKNNKDRLLAVVDEIEKFCRLDYNTKMDKYLKSFDNILHNQNLFFK